MSVTINSVPASYFVSVVPSVVGGGGTGLDLIELMLTTNNRVPIGSVLSFPLASSVSSYFGPTSTEAAAAAVYFNGYEGATKLPGALLFAQYPTTAVSAYAHGGSLASLTLAGLQALVGVLTISIDGTPVTSSTITLSSATSFTAAAALITTALGTTGPTQGSVTANIGAGFTYTGQASVWNGTQFVPSVVISAISAGIINAGDTYTDIHSVVQTITGQLTGVLGSTGTYTISPGGTAITGATTTMTSTVMDVTAVGSGFVAVGQEVQGSGVTASTYVTGLISGTGGAGTYRIGIAQHVVSEAITCIIPTVVWDSLTSAFVVTSGTTGATSTMGYGSGTIAASLALTQSLGCVLSQGAAAATPGPFMGSIVNQTTNWATFQTLFDPDNGSGNTQKQLFAAWVNSTNNRYAYLCGDTDITPTESTNAPTSLGAILQANGSSGTNLLWRPAGSSSHLSAFAGGYAASLNFDATNGRATFAYKSQSGLSAGVTDAVTAANLQANGYNFYVAEATANERDLFAYPGSITGPFQWFDSYINQIWFNNACQLALMTMLRSYGSIPYNPVGYGYIRAALADPVNAALNFGAIRPNVPLSSGQASEVNALAGTPVDQVLSTRGWYLVIQPATSQVRAARKSPTIILLYMDGQSIQQINLSSVLVQ